MKYCHAFIREYVPASLPSRERGLKYRTIARTQITRPVAPFAGAWIEIYDAATDDLWFLVAPFAGAWIEILGTFLPDVASSVAPFAGAWIEILCWSLASAGYIVAPFAGAWIEILPRLCL